MIFIVSDVYVEIWSMNRNVLVGGNKGRVRVTFWY